MAVITVSSESVPIVGSISGSSLTLRVFCNTTYTTYEGVTINQGDGVSLPWYTDYDCPVTSHVAARPAMTLYSTTDRLEQNLAPGWTGIWLDGSTNVGTYFSGYLIPSTPTTTTKAALDAFQPKYNNNQAINNQAYTTTQSNSLFVQLAGLDTDCLPKVVTDVPARLGNSLFHDDGAIARIQSSRIIFSTTNTRPSLKLTASGGGVPPIVEARTQNDLSIGLFKSGGVLMRYGFLGTAVLLTDPPFGLENQLLYTGSDDFNTLPDKIILRDPTDTLAAWAATMDITAGGANWSNTLVKVNDLGLTGTGKFAIMLPEQGAQIVGAGETFNIEFSGLAGLSATLQADIYGYWLY